jgi:hypothetical protein
MRFIQDIPHPQFRIGLYAWNGKYILKFDAGLYEQTYKVSEMDVTSVEDVQAMIDTPFLEQVSKRFQEMNTDWQATSERNDLL